MSYECGVCTQSVPSGETCDHGYASLRAEVERLRTRGETLAKAMREIGSGETHRDHAHPLGADRSMVIRFMSVALAALAEWEKP